MNILSVNISGVLIIFYKESLFFLEKVISFFWEGET